MLSEFRFFHLYLSFYRKNKKCGHSIGENLQSASFLPKNTSGMFLFSQSQTIFPEWSVLSGLVPRTAQCNPPSHRPFSRLRGATEPHTSCSHGKTCRKNPFTIDTILRQKKLQNLQKFFWFFCFCRIAQNQNLIIMQISQKYP